MNLLAWLFGCRCTKLSFPISRRKQLPVGWQKVTGTYVVCLDCGKEYPYDWNRMRVEKVPAQRKVKEQFLPLMNAEEMEK